MSELKWLDGYAGQTTDQLIALEATHRKDSIVLAFEQALDQKVGRLTDEEIVVLAVEALEREVNNGGFSAFFTNSSKEYAPLILGSLKQIGRLDVVRIASAALEILGLQENVTVAAVDAAMEKDLEERDENLSRLDKQYYDLRVDLSIPLLEFIKSNRHKIVL